MTDLTSSINNRKTRGVTLVELLVAITISSIVAIGIGSVYTGSKRSFKLQEEFSRMQENGRFAMNYIARFVRGAGFSGCSAALDNMVNNLDDQSAEFKFQTGIEGYEFSGTSPGQTTGTLSEFPTATSSTGNFATIGSTIDASLIGTLGPIPNTDILAARVADSSGIEIQGNKNAANFTINYTGTQTDGCQVNGKTEDGYSGICQGDTVVISDCEKSLAFVVTGLTPQPGGTPTEVLVLHSASAQTKNGKSYKNVEKSFGGNSGSLQDYEFAEGSDIVRVTTKFFYVAPGTTGPSLFMKSGTSAPVELVEGVESLQVLYGEDTDATPDNVPDHYVPADHLTDFSNVTAVKLSILLRSVNELAWRPDVSKTYKLGGMTSDTAVTLTAPQDKRLRKVMSMTIKLRNRAFSL